MVAENRKVFRSRGTTSRILSRASSKSMESRRSASSMTRYLMVRRWKPLVFSRWSTKRPGEATTTCGRLASAMPCVTMSRPPTITAVCSLMPLPMASNCSPICTQSSRVGARTTAKKRCGSSSSLCTMGNAKAPVLPLPVSARPMMSRPCKAQGIASCWIFVGRAHLMSLHAWQSSSHTPREAKVTPPSWMDSTSSAASAATGAAVATGIADASAVRAALRFNFLAPMAGRGWR
mmetsp:Transcript_102027/g.283984  ORF Transcript_102027/g.283984 Transcript_102027/m.283984 type:complete len:234 (-) Transcript_102027:55-756(-)